MPPFSPEAIPVNEIEVDGILTVVMEICIVGLLVYLGIYKNGKNRRKTYNQQSTYGMKMPF